MTTRKESKPRVPVGRTTRMPSVQRAPSVRTALLVFVAVLILVRWLNLFLALQIASTDRQIRMADDQRRQIERENSRLRYVIGQSESPRRLAQRALGLGYKAQQPLYIGLTDSGQEPSGSGDNNGPAGADLSAASDSAPVGSLSAASLPPGDTGAGRTAP